MKVLWTDAAVAQLEAIHDYVAQTSPEYARRSPYVELTLRQV